MVRLSREVLKDRINQAIFDCLDEIESDVGGYLIDDQAKLLTDSVFNVLSESDSDDLSEFIDTTDDTSVEEGSRAD